MFYSIAPAGSSTNYDHARRNPCQPAIIYLTHTWHTPILRVGAL